MPLVILGFLVLLCFGSVLNALALKIILAVVFGMYPSLLKLGLGAIIMSLTLNQYAVKVIWTVGVLLGLYWLFDLPMPIYQSFGG